jgi:hypothetical protein
VVRKRLEHHPGAWRRPAQGLDQTSMALWAVGDLERSAPLLAGQAIAQLQLLSADIDSGAA